MLVGYHEMIYIIYIDNEACSAELAIIISYPTCACGIIVTGKYMFRYVASSYDIVVSDQAINHIPALYCNHCKVQNTSHTVYINTALDLLLPNCNLDFYKELF